MRVLILALVAAVTFAPAEGATTYRIDPTNATIGFSVIKWTLLREEGVFREFTGTVRLDEKHIERSQVSFSVVSRSIDTKNANRDETLRSDDFLDVARHPHLTFQSRRVVPRGDRVVEVTGDLTIRGVTRRITIPVRFLGKRHEPGVGDIAAFETNFEIDRRHFGVLGSRWAGSTPGVLGNTISIRIVAGGISR